MTMLGMGMVRAMVMVMVEFLFLTSYCGSCILRIRADLDHRNSNIGCQFQISYFVFLASGVWREVLMLVLALFSFLK